jgi:hypothetical protein
MSATKLSLNNKIINGSFEYWQRGTSFATIANNIYHTDRFHYIKSGTMVHTIARSTDVPTDAFGTYSLLADVTTSQASLLVGSYTGVLQHIEGSVLKTFKSKKMVLTFRVKAFKTGTYCITLRNGTSTRAYIMEYTVNASNVWEKKVLRFTHDASGTWSYDNSIGLTIVWTIASGSTFHTSPNTWVNGNFLATTNQVNGVDNSANDFRLADVCMVEDNEGQTREPEFVLAGRDIFEELQLCRRYYETSLGSSGTPAFFNGQASKIWWVVYGSRKRVVPILAQFNQASGSVVVGGYQSGIDGFGAYLTGTVTGNANYIDFTADAEL